MSFSLVRRCMSSWPLHGSLRAAKSNVSAVDDLISSFSQLHLKEQKRFVHTTQTPRPTLPLPPTVTKCAIVGAYGVGKTTLAFEKALALKCEGKNVDLIQESVRCPLLPLDPERMANVAIRSVTAQICKELESVQRGFNVIVADASAFDIFVFPDYLKVSNPILSAARRLAEEWLKTYDEIYWIRPKLDGEKDIKSASDEWGTDLKFLQSIDEGFKHPLNTFAQDSLEIVRAPLYAPRYKGSLLQTKPQIPRNSIKKIAFVGTHGMGKSTASFRKAAEFQREGSNVHVIKESVRFAPFPINAGHAPETSLWACTAQICKEVEAAQRRFDVLICDRSAYDTFMYSSYFKLKNPLLDAARQLAKEWLTTYDRIIWMRPMPTAPHEELQVPKDGVRSVDLPFLLGVDKIFEKDMYPLVADKVKVLYSKNLLPNGSH
jgi:hypothetical protein